MEKLLQFICIQKQVDKLYTNMMGYHVPMLNNTMENIFTVNQFWDFQKKEECPAVDPNFLFTPIRELYNIEI